MDSKQIIERIAEDNGLTVEELLERSQQPKRRAAIRQLYLALKEAGQTIKEIGEATGRDVSTIVRVLRDFKRELQLRGTEG